MGSYKFGRAIIGGTFDHFHKGHKFFIDKAFANCQFVTIGITEDAFAKKKEFSNLIENYKTREKSVLDYLNKKGFLDKAKIIPINDIYGTSLVDEKIEVIFVDEMGYENALKINAKRKEKGFTELKIIKNEYIKDDEGKILSSTNIRKGHENRQGYIYKKAFNTSEVLSLPLTLRDNLRKPFGRIVTDFENKNFENNFIIAVGDIVVSKLIEKEITPNITLFDLKTKREEISDESVLKYLPKKDLTIKNQQGTISREGVDALEKAIAESLMENKSINIKVIGEEDLLALPAMLLSPLKSLVVYGIRNVGAVIVEVEEELKEKIRKEYVEKLI